MAVVDARERNRGIPDAVEGPTVTARLWAWWVDRARLRLALAVGAVVLVLAPALLGAFRAPGAPMEEGKLLVAGELVLDGAVPHDDFEHFYGPGDVWTIATAMRILGPTLTAERLVGSVYFVVFVASVFALTRRYGLTAASIAAITAGIVQIPFGVHAYSWSGGVAFGLAAIALTTAAMGPVAPSQRDAAGAPFVATSDVAARRCATAAGLCAGFALLLRADLVLAIGAAALVFAPRLRPSLRRRGLLAAIATCVLPYLLHVVVAGPRPVIDGMIVSTLSRLRAGRSLPIPPPGDDLTAWLDLSAPDPEPSRFLPDTALVVQLQAFFWLTVLAAAALLIVGVFALRRRRTHPVTPSLAATCFFAVLLVPQVLQRADATHVRFAASTVLAIAPVAVAAGIHLLDLRLPRGWAAAQFGVMTAVALALLVPYYTFRLTSLDIRRGLGIRDVAVVEHDGRRFPVIDPIVDDVNGMLDIVDVVGPGDGTVFVGPQELRLANYSDSFIYHLLPSYEPASYYLESNPGIANRPGSGLADDLRDADLLILSDEYDNWDEPNASREFGPDEPNQVVDEVFCVAGEVGRYQVHIRQDAPEADQYC